MPLEDQQIAGERATSNRDFQIQSNVSN